jgi:uncharacterized protein
MIRRVTRRAFLHASCCVAGIAAVDGLAIEPSWLEIAEHDVPIPRLPAALQGFRIAHLSDVHLRGLGRVHDKAIDAIRRLEPDLVVLTGDSIESESSLGVLEEFCRRLAAPGREVLATVGNWEHWGRVPLRRLSEVYARAGATLLGNESVLLKRGVSIVATDDFCSGHDDLRASLANVPSAPARLFLTHAHCIFERLPPGAPRFDLGLAGHTHGGQIRALGTPVWVPPGSGRFRSGMYDTAHGRVYVSRGVGTSVLPVRLTCRPELPVFRLIAG